MTHKPLSSYRIAADISHIQCIDERPTEEKHVTGVKLPGAVYGLIDAMKVVGKLSEGEAWKQAKECGIPIDIHTDNHHHDNPGLGCGYAGLVEKNHEGVGASESVVAADRYTRASHMGGNILHYTGAHNPIRAILNTKKGTTFDQLAMWDDHAGSFVCDIWAVTEYAKKVGLDPEAMKAHIIHAFKATVKLLANIDIIEKI